MLLKGSTFTSLAFSWLIILDLFSVGHWAIASDNLSPELRTFGRKAEKQDSSPELQYSKGKYTNFLIGLSLSYPKDLEFFSDTIETSTINENISLGHYFRRSTSRERLFGFIFVREQFNLENHYEYGWDLEEISSFFGGNIAYAMPAPQKYPIKNIRQIQFGRYTYYTYAVKMGGDFRRYCYIYPRNDCYYKFFFYRNDPELIKEILDPAEYIESVFINTFKLGRRIDNPKIGLISLVVPFGWTAKNTNTDTTLRYTGPLGQAVMLVDNKGDQSKIYQKLNKVIVPATGFPGVAYHTDREIYREIQDKFGCKMHYFADDGSNRQSLSCVMPQKADGSSELYSYLYKLNLYITVKYQTSSLYETNVLGIYIDQILKSKFYDHYF